MVNTIIKETHLMREYEAQARKKCEGIQTNNLYSLCFHNDRIKFLIMLIYNESKVVCSIRTIQRLFVL